MQFSSAIRQKKTHCRHPVCRIVQCWNINLHLWYFDLHFFFKDLYFLASQTPDFFEITIKETVKPKIKNSFIYLPSCCSKPGFSWFCGTWKIIFWRMFTLFRKKEIINPKWTGSVKQNQHKSKSNRNLSVLNYKLPVRKRLKLNVLFHETASLL